MSTFGEYWPVNGACLVIGEEEKIVDILGSKEVHHFTSCRRSWGKNIRSKNNNTYCRMFDLEVQVDIAWSMCSTGSCILMI